MKHRNYALYDATAKTFLRPVICTNDGDAIRLFTNWVNDEKKETNISKYPEQFKMYYVGEWDDEKGVFDTADHPTEIIHGIQLIAKQDKRYTLEDLINTILKTQGN